MFELWNYWTVCARLHLTAYSCHPKVNNSFHSSRVRNEHIALTEFDMSDQALVIVLFPGALAMILLEQRVNPCSITICPYSSSQPSVTLVPDNLFLSYGFII